jgi:predicted site-specific integrase-resolvase
MSLADAARELDVSPATLRRWVADGLVPLAQIADAQVKLKGCSQSTELFLAQRVRA